MPYKTEILTILDTKSYECEYYNTCNTVLIENGKLSGHNCDYYGMVHVLKNLELTDSDSVTILGNGSMSKMFCQHLKKYNLNICARNNNTWHHRHRSTDVLINCTGLGTSIPDSPVEKLPNNISLVIDLAINKNQLQHQCNLSNVKYVSGKEFYKYQFLKQFELYTGIQPKGSIYDRYEKI
jgi:shikimate 5-dehydrogenase